MLHAALTRRPCILRWDSVGGAKNPGSPFKNKCAIHRTNFVRCSVEGEREDTIGRRITHLSSHSLIMTNIPVERARGTGGTPPLWVWLLGLIILIGLIWLIASMVTNDDPDRTAPPPEDRRTAPPGQPGDPAVPPQQPGTPPPGQPGSPGTTTSILAPAGSHTALVAQAAEVGLQAAMDGSLRISIVAIDGSFFATAAV